MALVRATSEMWISNGMKLELNSIWESTHPLVVEHPGWFASIDPLVNANVSIPPAETPRKPRTTATQDPVKAR